LAFGKTPMMRYRKRPAPIEAVWGIPLNIRVNPTVSASEARV
jgi:hypothetical protein